jgi:hypothetical protein
MVWFFSFASLQKEDSSFLEQKTKLQHKTQQMILTPTSWSDETMRSGRRKKTAVRRK